MRLRHPNGAPTPPQPVHGAARQDTMVPAAPRRSPRIALVAGGGGIRGNRPPPSAPQSRGPHYRRVPVRVGRSHDGASAGARSLRPTPTPVAHQRQGDRGGDSVRAEPDPQLGPRRRRARPVGGQPRGDARDQQPLHAVPSPPPGPPPPNPRSPRAQPLSAGQLAALLQQFPGRPTQPSARQDGLAPVAGRVCRPRGRVGTPRRGPLCHAPEHTLAAVQLAVVVPRRRGHRHVRAAVVVGQQLRQPPVRPHRPGAGPHRQARRSRDGRPAGLAGPAFLATGTAMASAAFLLPEDCGLTKPGRVQPLARHPHWRLAAFRFLPGGRAPRPSDGGANRTLTWHVPHPSRALAPLPSAAYAMRR